MNILSQLGIILAVCVLGEALSVLTGGFLPGNVIGMIMLFVLLITKVLKVKHVENAAEFFLKNMSIFFIPVNLGIIEIYPTIKNEIVKIIILCILTTIITAFVTVFAVNVTLKLQKNMKKEDDTNV